MYTVRNSFICPNRVVGIKTNLANKARLVQLQTGASATYPHLFPCRPSQRNDREGRVRSYSKPAWSKVRKPMLICFERLIHHARLHYRHRCYPFWRWKFTPCARMAQCWYHRNLSDAHCLGTEVNPKKKFPKMERWRKLSLEKLDSYGWVDTGGLPTAIYLYTSYRIYLYIRVETL